MPRALTAVLAVFATLTAAAAAAPACDPERIEILAGPGSRSFAIEIADDPEEQVRGLMFRPALAADAGMLFVYATPRRANFWMRNTMIALDLIFIDDSGRIESIAERADPYSERVSSSEGEVRAVLEINGGLARALGIGRGDQVIHPAFREAPDEVRCPD